MLNYRQYDELRHASPFRAFRIVTTDGAKYDVPHRDFTWRAPGVSTIIVVVNEAYHMIDPPHITRFEFTSANGRKKPKRSRKTK